MDRRSFLKTLSGLLLPVAPAICRAEWLMPVVPRNDWAYLMTYLAAQKTIPEGSYLIHRPLELRWSNWAFHMPPNVRIATANGCKYVMHASGRPPLHDIIIDMGGGGCVDKDRAVIEGSRIVAEKLRAKAMAGERYLGRAVTLKGDVINGEFYPAKGQA